MGRKKTKSHRQTLEKKYMIQKKVKAHKKKLNKRSKQNKGNGQRKKMSRDPGIPNMFPYKEALLKQILHHKKAEIAEKLQLKVRQKQLRASKLAEVAKQTAKDADSAQSWEDRQKDRLERKRIQEEQSKGSKKYYFRELNKVIDASDVVLMVLDARDPMGCRCPEVEDMVLSQTSPKTGKAKRVILVLNKIDLVPAEVTAQWMALFRREYPTVVFKASTQEQNANLGHAKTKGLPTDELLANSRRCVGGDVILQLLKNYSRTLDLKQAITVGVIGYPNVGKSSVINSLKRSKSTGTSATAGFTKVVQEVRIDKHLTLLDSPGVLFAAGTENDATLALRNVLRVEQLDDPVAAAEAIVRRCPVEQLMQVYQIPLFSNAQEFLLHVANKRGKIKKGGVPDLPATAVIVLRDWNSGRIAYYCAPPATDAESARVGAATVVGAWGAEFDVDALLEANAAEVRALDMSGGLAVSGDAITMESSGFGTLDPNFASADADMDTEETTEPSKETVYGFQTPSAKSEGSSAPKSKPRPEDSLPQNQTVNQNLRRQQKAARKTARKDAENDVEMGNGSDYDFEADWQD
eukprot:109632_1